MQIIDAHCHIMPPELIERRQWLVENEAWFGRLYASPNARLANAETLIASMDGAEIGASVCFGFAFADQGLCQTCNDYVLDVARRYPGRIIPLAVTNPQSGRASQSEVRRCLEAGACGVGELMPDGQGYDLDDSSLVGLMDVAQAMDVPVLTHTNEPVGHDYAGKGAQGPVRALRLAQQFPDNKLILAHWGGGLVFYELMPKVRRSLRNVYYDTAASLYLYDDQIFRVTAGWAADKVLFATDYPLIGQRRFLNRVYRAGVAAENSAALLGDNARRLFGLVDKESDHLGSNGADVHSD